MRKFIKTLIVSALAGCCLLIEAGASGTVTINSLIENILVLDAQQVTVEGEAIGEALQRGEYAWVNINDGTNAIGIWLTAEDAEKIAYFGDYKHAGDILRITGTFSRDCKEHGGDVDIHCGRMEIVSTGHTIQEDIEQTKVLTAVLLFCAAVVITGVYLTVRRPKRSE